MHLVIANEILEAGTDSPEVQRYLWQRRGDFLLGSIAPDVRTVSGASRRETHFFSVRTPNERPSPEALLVRHPQLARPKELSPALASFMAGYLSHLLIDEMWIEDIFRPYFGRQLDYGSFQRRLVLHNVLRAHLDERDRPRLDEATLACLRAVPIAYSLPFASDEDLRTWRDLICQQLAPGASVRTVEIFAQRLGVPPSTVESLLSSPEVLRNEVLGRLPPGKLAEFRRQAVDRGCQLVEKYLRGGYRAIA